MTEYLLIFRDEDNRWPTMSPQEMQDVIERFDTWRAELETRDCFVAAGKLTQDLGHVIRKPDTDFVTDGPFCEAKEAVSGFYCVRAESLEAACEVAKKFPMLDYGSSVEVRELALVQV